MTSDTYIVVSVTQMQTPLKVPSVQGDTGRRLTMVFSDLTIPSGAAADIYVRKSDGEIYNSGTVGSADNLSTATFELTSTALEEAGEIPAQVRITDGEDIITSFPFFLCVAESLIDSGAIEGTNEFTSLEEAIAAANTATQNANSAASSANQTVTQLQQNYQAATEQAQQQYEAATQINLKIDDFGNLVDGGGTEVTPKITGNEIITTAKLQVTNNFGPLVASYDGISTVFFDFNLTEQSIIRIAFDNTSVRQLYTTNGGSSWQTIYTIPSIQQADYIVEQGTSGIWTYRKWNSGAAECWCTRYIGGQSFSNPWGGLYITSNNIVSQMAYPFSFAGGTIPSELLTVQTAFEGSMFLINGTARNSNTHTGSYTLASATNTVKDCNISYHVIGRWM